MDHLRKSVFSLLINRLNYTLFTESMFLLAYRSSRPMCSMSTGCPFYHVHGHSSIITQVNLHPPGYPATFTVLRDTTERTLCMSVLFYHSRIFWSPFFHIFRLKCCVSFRSLHCTGSARLYCIYCTIKQTTTEAEVFEVRSQSDCQFRHLLPVRPPA